MKIFNEEDDFERQYQETYELIGRLSGRYRLPRHLEKHDFIMSVMERLIIVDGVFQPTRLTGIRDVRSFANTVASNLFTDLFRKEKVHRKYQQSIKHLDTPSGEEPDPDFVMVIDALLQECVEELPEKPRLVIKCMLKKLSIDETMVELNMTRKEIYKYRTMAKKKLKALLYKNLVQRKAYSLIHLFYSFIQNPQL